MKVTPFSRREVYLLSDVEEGDLKGVVPDWVRNISINYNPVSGNAEFVMIMRDPADKEFEKYFNQKKAEYRQKRETARKEGNMEEWRVICKEEDNFEKTYVQGIRDPEQIQKIIEFLQTHKSLESRV